MERDSVENFRGILTRFGMWVNSDKLDQMFGFVSGFNAASDPPILDGFREWLLDTYPQCSGPFGFEMFIYQIFRIRALWTLGQEREANDAFVAILKRFLDCKYGRTA